MMIRVRLTLNSILFGLIFVVTDSALPFIEILLLEPVTAVPADDDSRFGIVFHVDAAAVGAFDQHLHCHVVAFFVGGLGSFPVS